MRKQNKKSVILALDVSSKKTGYSVLRNGRWNKSNKSYGAIEIDGSLSFPEKLVYFRDKLVKLVNEVKPTIIVIEDVFSGRNISTMKLLARFNGVAVEVCRRLLKKDPIIVLAAEVRSFLECGKSKKDAFDFICEKYDLDWKFSKMNDITDALCLALFAHKSKKKELTI